MASCVFNVGDQVERDLDGLWYSALIVDITEVETFLEDGTSTCRRSYDIRYNDDEKIESCVQEEELRLVPAARPPAAPRVFPGNIDRYKQAQRSAASSPSSLEESAEKEQSPSPARGISLEVFRRVLRAVTRPSAATSLQHSSDEHCDTPTHTGSGRGKGRFNLRRHSFAGPGRAAGALALPIAIQFSPFASCCQECSKWTVLRCRRCGGAFYCSRACQIQAWPDHSVCCKEREFRPLLDGAAVSTSAAVDEVPDDQTDQGRGSGRAVGAESTAVGYVSMNPMHMHLPAAGAIVNSIYAVSPDSPANDLNSHTAAGLRPVQLYNGGNNVVEMAAWRPGERQDHSQGRAQPSPTEIDWDENGTSEGSTATEPPSAQLIGPRPAFSTPPRTTVGTSTAEASQTSSFSAEEAAGLASMLNVRVEAAVDALKRNNGDANAAAEWLLSVPSYVAVNSAQVAPEPSQMCGPQPLSYPSNNLRVVEAHLDGATEYPLDSKSVASARDDDEWSDSIELFAGQFSIRGRSCDVLVTQRSAYDFTTTVTIYPKGHAVLRPILEGGQSNESRTVFRVNAAGGVDRSTVRAGDLTKCVNADGVPMEFEVDHLPAPANLNEIDDDIYPSHSGGAPRDHVLVLQQESLRRLLESGGADGVNCDALLDTTEATNFQRARRILHALEPYYVNPFREMCLSSEQQASTVPIGGVSRFPNYYIMVYKIYESSSPPRSLCAQSVRPERVYIQLGSLDAAISSPPRSPSTQTLIDREELFTGSRREPAPIMSTNPFDDEPLSSGPYDYAENEIPDLIDVTTGEVARTVIKPEDIQMIVDMFGIGRQEAETYLQQANGSVEAAANLILN